MTNLQEHAPSVVDVLIVGGGLSGMSLGIALAKQGVRTAIVDREPPEAMADAHFDGRTTAIALGPQRFLDTVGIWARLAAAAEPILDIRVTDQATTPFVHYDHRDVGNEPFGWIVENVAFRRALATVASELSDLRLIAPATIEVEARDRRGVTVRLSTGGQLQARLLVAADGKGSPLREQAGIRTVGWRYRQEAIACTIEHEKPHYGVAVENFFPSGPFATLPLARDRSSIVWSERADLVPHYLALPPASFEAEVAKRVGGWLGRIRLTGPRERYPLQAFVATRLVSERLALVADAGHVIHPIAGQGLNLGLRDVERLAKLVVDTHRLGLDVGSPTLLANYERDRRADILAFTCVTDGLNRLFSNDIAPVKLARRLGLGVVERLQMVKRPLMRHAMGLSPLLSPD